MLSVQFLGTKPLKCCWYTPCNSCYMISQVESGCAHPGSTKVCIGPCVYTQGFTIFPYLKLKSSKVLPSSKSLRSGVLFIHVIEFHICLHANPGYYERYCRQVLIMHTHKMQNNSHTRNQCPIVESGGV